MHECSIESIIALSAFDPARAEIPKKYLKIGSVKIINYLLKRIWVNSKENLKKYLEVPIDLIAYGTLVRVTIVTVAIARSKL